MVEGSLAGAHREVPSATDPAWRDRWSAEAARYGAAAMPTTFDDPPEVGSGLHGVTAAVDARTDATVQLVRRAVIPRLVREATDRGWWDPIDGVAGTDPMPGASTPKAGHVAVLDMVDRATWSGLTLAPRVIAPWDAAVAHAIVAAALDDGALVTAAVQDTTVVGLVVVDRPGGELLALGVAPSQRRTGIARDLLAVERARPDGSAAVAELTMAERDVEDPLDRSVRASVARGLLEAAGFTVVPPDPVLQALDPMLLALQRPSAVTTLGHGVAG